jgi:hypothetical protein
MKEYKNKKIEKVFTKEELTQRYVKAYKKALDSYAKARAKRKSKKK